MTKRTITFVLILILAAIFRLYRIGDLAIFNLDQAENAIAERQIIVNRDLILLGPDDHFGGLSIYYGPIHYYLMAPALAVSNFNPIGTHIWMGILGVVTTAIVYLVSRSLMGTLFFAAYPWTMFYGRIDWLPSAIPLFTATLLLALRRKRFFWAGLSIGFATQLHTTAGITFVIALIYFLLNRRLLTIRNLVFLALGLLVGFSPMIIFDLRHNFLYTRSYLSLFAAHPYKGLFPHYFIWLIPVVGVLWNRLPKIPGLLLVVLCLFVTIEWLAAAPQEIPRNPRVISEISKIIVADNNLKKPFNIASFIDAETRGTAYRYFLDLYGNKPLNYDQYHLSDYLYVVTYESAENIMSTNIYEITSFSPKRATASWQTEGINIYRLEK